MKWAREKLHWRIEGQWDRVIFLDESQVVVGNINRIYIWQKKDEAESIDCVCPPAQKTFGHDLGMHITLRCGGNYDSEWHYT